jgi:hypothetical protein
MFQPELGVRPDIEALVASAPADGAALSIDTTSPKKASALEILNKEVRNPS